MKKNTSFSFMLRAYVDIVPFFSNVPSCNIRTDEHTFISNVNVEHSGQIKRSGVEHSKQIKRSDDQAYFSPVPEMKSLLRANS